MGTKNCPETPRQKMINMMYLVFVAMMALNVASEVLDAFKVVDASLNQTLGTVDLKNNQIYASFSKAYAENPSKVKEWHDKAFSVKTETDSLIKQIQDLKEYLVLSSGGKNLNLPENEDAYIGQMPILMNSRGDSILITKEDDLNTPSEILITQKGAEELKQDIIEHRNFLISFLDEDSPMIEALEHALDVSDPPVNKREGGEKKTWEIQNFENKPLIAIMTLLSKLQIDIQDAETNVITNLYSQIDASSFKFNKLGAHVLPKSTYLLEGDVFEAQIFLGAEDTTQQPEIFVNNRKLPIVDGKGIYKVPASEVGTFKWGGLIKYKTPEGNYNSYPFKSEYQVGRPTATISPTKMNVLYQGLANPISISVPGVATENLSARMTNGKLEKKGNEYLAYPTDLDPNAKRTKIDVFANVNGTERSMGSMPFRVKEVPPPVAEIAGLNGGTIRKEILLSELGVFAELKDFDFDLKYKITQFNISFTGTYTRDYASDSNMFTNEQKAEFAKLTQGSMIYIDNIKAQGDNGVSKDLSPISFKIK